MTNLTIHLVRTETEPDGTTREWVTSTNLPNRAPFRIHARANVAFRIGQDYVRGIDGTDTDVVAVTISTTRANRGRMALASWRWMPTLSTPKDKRFTGTHTLHPLVKGLMRGETYGQYLTRRMSEVV
jgi:hypothetical protein